MKITLAATAFAIIFILPLVVPAPAAPQDQPTGVHNTQNGSPIPGPGEDLPPETSGAEPFQWKDKYPDSEGFCSDDMVSRNICQPLVDNTPKVLARVCQSYRAGHLPNVTFHPGVGFVGVDTDLQHFCDRFFSLSTGTTCQLGGAACELSTPAPLGSKCECTLPFGPVVGTVVNQ
jgi:hypothetical protein